MPAKGGSFTGALVFTGEVVEGLYWHFYKNSHINEYFMNSKHACLSYFPLRFNKSSIGIIHFMYIKSVLLIQTVNVRF